MEEDNWSEIICDVAKCVGTIALFAVLCSLGGKGESTPEPTVWKPKFYRPTGGPKGWDY